jgi:predicted transcriptional regulator of viral defense system
VNAVEALSRVRALGVPMIETADAAAALRQSPSATTRTLSRLAQAGLITSVRQGTWWVRGDVDPYLLPVYLTAPLDSYLSLQTALHLHGMIEQVPSVYYAVSLARTQRIATRVGVFSFHHLAPEVFGGYLETQQGVRLATPEKTLFDLAYLSAGRSRIFTALPELELPRGFRRKELARWVAAIRSERSRTITQRKLEQFLTAADRRSDGEAADPTTAPRRQRRLMR